MENESSPTRKQQLQRWIENHPVLAVVALLAAIASSTMAFITDVSEFFGRLVPEDASTPLVATMFADTVDAQEPLSSLDGRLLQAVAEPDTFRVLAQRATELVIQPGGLVYLDSPTGAIYVNRLRMGAGATIRTRGGDLRIVASEVVSSGGAIVSFAEADTIPSPGSGTAGEDGRSGGTLTLHLARPVIGSMEVRLDGQNGQDGGSGLDGEKGQTGPRGRRASSGLLDCSRGGGKGGTGGPGEPGGDGGSGGDGGAGGIVSLMGAASESLGNLIVSLRGGAPGLGGVGGRGGDGGDGGPGGNGDGHCDGGDRGDRGPEGDPGVRGADGERGEDGRIDLLVGGAGGSDDR